MTEALLTQDRRGSIEPKTFVETAEFLRRMNQEYLLGRISWESLWYYEREYGFGPNRGKPLTELQHESGDRGDMLTLGFSSSESIMEGASLHSAGSIPAMPMTRYGGYILALLGVLLLLALAGMFITMTSSLYLISPETAVLLALALLLLIVETAIAMTLRR